MYLVDAKKVGEQTGARRSPEQEIRFFDVEYPMPADLIADKRKVTVRFEATNGRSTPSVFGVRIVRSGRNANSQRLQVLQAARVSATSRADGSIPQTGTILCGARIVSEKQS